MKWWVLLFIILGGCFLFLGLALFIPVLALDQSWWWFFGTLIGEAFLGLIGLVILLIVKLSKRKPEEPKIDVKGAINKTIHEQKYDINNPDNFVPKWWKRKDMMAKGTIIMKILEVHGKGTELNEDRIVLINLDNAKQAQTLLINKTDEEVRIAAIEMAGVNLDEIKEEIITGTDKYGRPLTTVKSSIPTELEKKIEEEKKEAEESKGL